MKWIDYREKLGIGFNDDQKLTALKSKIFGMIDTLKEMERSLRIEVTDFKSYYMMIGETPYNSYYSSFDRVYYSLDNAKDLCTLISKCVAFVNAAHTCFVQGFVPNTLKENIMRYLDELNIEFDLITDDDGIFIFPKGVPEFDEALVSASLTWLKDYPKAEKAWSNALRAYSEVNADTASRVADDFRKALERFFQEFFQTGDGKTLENCKADYGKYLKDNGVPSEVSNNLETLLQAYTNYMNKYAKHTDKAKINVLEYLMYQTGNIIRLVIMLKQGEAQ